MRQYLAVPLIKRVSEFEISGALPTTNAIDPTLERTT
jgi:hypothetical protein